MPEHQGNDFDSSTSTRSSSPAILDSFDEPFITSSRTLNPTIPTATTPNPTMTITQLTAAIAQFTASNINSSTNMHPTFLLLKSSLDAIQSLQTNVVDLELDLDLTHQEKTSGERSMVDELASLFQKNQDLVAENHRLAAANHQLMGYLGDVFSELRVLDEETRMRSGGRGERMGDETYRRVERHVGSGSWDREEEEHARRQMEEYQEQLRRQEEEIAGEFDGPEFADMNFEINANGERRFWGME